MSPPNSDRSQNKYRFYAPFLDGFRGVAALGVVYAHSQVHYDQRLAVRIFDSMGAYGVYMFFVLSAFLLTFRTLLDWERYHEKQEENNVVNKVEYLKSCVDLENNLSVVPLLSLTVSDNTTNMPSLEEKQHNTFCYYIQNKIWPKFEIPIKFWLKYFLRRFMRIYPPYVILLPFIAYNEFVRGAFKYTIGPSDLIPHLFLQSAKFNFWTIPVEITYYFCIPIIIIGYVEFARFGAFLTNRYFRKPAIGAWICRIIFNVIIVTKRTDFLLAPHNIYDEDFQNNVQVFLAGSICAIWYREIIRLGLLPLSLEEERTQLNNSNNYNISRFIKSSFAKFIVSKLPSRHQFARCFFDCGCYFVFLLKYCTLPHPADIVFGLPRSNYEMILERNVFGGSLDAILILFCLLSRNGTFVNTASWNFFRFCGKISFSLYLLHPISMTFVNEYIPSIGVNERGNESDEEYKASLIFDAIIMSYVLTIILSWLYYKFVERPSLNLANYIVKRWLDETKPEIKSDVKEN
ncbi:10565_t:CDS:2 [Scutellospora calospora]|uniref:10565_t:CDS:1 n=1 Tax=Scutellospora calospora TaxID=85575 RepID=A0ACA9KEG6_9GLOM|nr:10565_t:CDS:2 [Scutellospora calospora]